VTIPDGASIEGGTVVRKTWLLRASTGTVPAGSTLVFTNGDKLSVSVEPINNSQEVAEGSEFTLTASFQAPTEAGHYRSFFRLATADGHHFGPSVWVDINIVVPSTTEAAVQNAESVNETDAPQTDEQASKADEAAVVSPVATQDASTAPNTFLPQILAGINVAPDVKKAELASLLYHGLDGNDFTAVIAALAELNINLE